MWILLLVPPVFGLLMNIASSVYAATQSAWYVGVAVFTTNLVFSLFCGSVATPKDTSEGSWIGLFAFAAGSLIASLATVATILTN